jgi:2,3-dihydroxybiphenyl 1,2-dioxygenase
MTLSALGYVGLRSDRLADWAAFGPAFLGLQLVERTGGVLKFRMDDRRQRIIVSDAEDAAHTFGWEVADATAMDAVAARIEAARLPVERMLSADLALRGVTAGIRFADPAGNRLEAFHGPESAETAFRPGRPISGFRTGPLGMGHVVLHVESVDDLQWFYQDVLGFRLTDYALKPFRIFFFHINARHHSIALVETGRSGIHHVMMELLNLDDVGQGYDLALAEPERISTTLGRHTNDFMTSFYARTPGDFLVEYGWGGRSIDPANWQPGEMHHGTSLWGHERAWLPPDRLAEARRLRAKVASEGLRQPVQVMEGNYVTGPTGCTWWEQIKGRRV